MWSFRSTQPVAPAASTNKYLEPILDNFREHESEAEVIIKNVVGLFVKFMKMLGIFKNCKRALCRRWD
jgi:hypothetical protein